MPRISCNRPSRMYGIRTGLVMWSGISRLIYIKRWGTVLFHLPHNHRAVTRRRRYLGRGRHPAIGAWRPPVGCYRSVTSRTEEDFLVIQTGWLEIPRDRGGIEFIGKNGWEPDEQGIESFARDRYPCLYVLFRINFIERNGGFSYFSVLEIKVTCLFH